MRSLSELAGRRARSRRRREEIVAPVIRLIGSLLAERSAALEHPAIEQRRADPLQDRERLARAADDDRALRAFGDGDDRLGDGPRLVDRRDRLRLDSQLRTRMREEGRIHRRGQNERDRHVAPLMFKFEPQGFGEAFDAMLAGATGGLQRDRAQSQSGGDVDDRSLILPPHWRERRLHPVDLAEQIDPEDALDLLNRHLSDGRVDADRCVVDPRIDPAEALDRLAGQPLDLLPDRHVGDDHVRSAAKALDFRGDLLQGPFIAGRKHDRGASAAEGQRGFTADAGRGASNDDDLVAYGTRHERSLLEMTASGAQ